jgi:cupin 2 domain-containing protein
MITVSNLVESIPAVLPDELFQDIATAPGVRIERIVSRGHRSPEGFWYDQAWDEWVLLFRGSAGLEIEGRPDIIPMHAGDHLMISAGTRHRVAWTDDTDDTIWLAVHIHSGDNL